MTKRQEYESKHLNHKLNTYFKEELLEINNLRKSVTFVIENLFNMK